MALKSLIKKYKVYEAKELARRRDKAKNLKPYKALKRKAFVKKKLSSVKKTVGSFDKTKYAKAIGNPYGTKFPKAKNVLKNIKNKKIRRKRKVV